MKRYQIFISIFLFEIIVLVFLLFSASAQVAKGKKEMLSLKDLCSELSLTDLSVWTEARYTRNPSQADWFSPFQDFPSSVEHFPAGSLIEPPMRRKR